MLAMPATKVRRRRRQKFTSVLFRSWLLPCVSNGAVRCRFFCPKQWEGAVASHGFRLFAAGCCVFSFAHARVRMLPLLPLLWHTTRRQVLRFCRLRAEPGSFPVDGISDGLSSESEHALFIFNHHSRIGNQPNFF